MLLRKAAGAFIRAGKRLIQPDVQIRHGIISMQGSLRNLRRNGFIPKVIIDVGAYQGDWSAMARGVFASAPIVMIEANPDKLESLSVAAGSLGPNVKTEIALLGRVAGETLPFYVMETGSSVLSELTPFDRRVKNLTVRTLDDVMAGHSGEGPSLLKLDVQGYELEVLRGASKTITSAEVIVIEVSLLEYNKGAPLMHEVVGFLGELGFVPYDICGMLRRRTDLALFQIDMIFVRAESNLRARRSFWNAEIRQ